MEMGEQWHYIKYLTTQTNKGGFLLSFVCGLNQLEEMKKKDDGGIEKRKGKEGGELNWIERLD